MQDLRLLRAYLQEGVCAAVPLQALVHVQHEVVVVHTLQLQQAATLSHRPAQHELPARTALPARLLSEPVIVCPALLLGLNSNWV